MALRLGLHMYKVELVNLHKRHILQMNEKTVALVITRLSALREMGPLNCHYMDPINLKAERNHTAAKQLTQNYLTDVKQIIKK